MALSTQRIADLSIAAMVSAEDAKMRAYSGFTLLALVAGPWAKPGEGIDEKALRAHLAVEVAKLKIGGVEIISKNTWQSYVAGIFRSATKFADNLSADEDFLSIRDMEDDDAIDAVQNLYCSMGVTSGSDIRDFAKAEGFEFFDKDAIKAAAKAAAAAKANEKNATAAALFFARTSTDSSTVTAAPAAPVTALDAILAAIATLGHADAISAMAALNAHMAALDATVEAAPAPTTAPVLSDDAVVDARSALAAHFNKAA